MKSLLSAERHSRANYNIGQLKTKEIQQREVKPNPADGNS